MTMCLNNVALSPEDVLTVRIALELRASRLEREALDPQHAAEDTARMRQIMGELAGVHRSISEITEQTLARLIPTKRKGA